MILKDINMEGVNVADMKIEDLNEKEKVIDKLLNRTTIKVDGKQYKVKEGETLVLNTIDSYLKGRMKDGKEI